MNFTNYFHVRVFIILEEKILVKLIVQFQDSLLLKNVKFESNLKFNSYMEPTIVATFIISKRRGAVCKMSVVGSNPIID